MIPYNEWYVFFLFIAVVFHSLIWFYLSCMLSLQVLTNPTEKARVDKLKAEDPVRYKKNKRKWRRIYFLSVPLYMVFYALAEVVTHNLWNSAVFGTITSHIIVIIIAIVVAEKEKRLKKSENVEE